MDLPIIEGSLVALAVLVGKAVRVDRPENTFVLRVVWAITQLLIFASLYIIRQRIAKADDKTVLEYQDKETRDKIRTTHHTYDNYKLEKLAKDQAIIVAITAFIHYQWGHLLILLLHAVLSASTIAQVPLFKIWILGKKPEGDLKRPWKGDAVEKDKVKLR
ncbi:hypothetical protein HK097_009527 [Rhizophlyctis rosea]|uniref:Uncharacterized protein n=1 Tax=Rhizophlyctis rosea TaxID=64517 RepID=A0AAD5X4H1_9FUNG|nr:hypothetical protein HK097_009527 [Rhizophlyctis rosea]